MASTGFIDELPEFIPVRLSHRVRIAAELAAIARAKPMSDLLEDILVDYLSATGYLGDRS